ncbi:hypothetical protein [Gynuella sunshinyii]|uniref:Uncharacterized protein n=1 Tax=Gynuella sunshinyii YC6258 TaxID=1445510 RepID=A0A0C5VHB2_9GAMM|nr:hypothetical protein [Gynuella sunshinyii]AJQ94047.1 hypothetical Protein YC6258_02003 [Gynuella sunshinyii YC6258]
MLQSHRRTLVEQTVRSKLFLSGLFSVLFISGIMFWGSLSWHNSLARQAFQQNAQLLLRQTAEHASPFLQTNNVISLNLMLKSLLAESGINYAAFRDASGNVLTELKQNEGHGVDFRQSVIFENAVIGDILLTIEMPTNHHTIWLWLLVVWALGIALWLAFCIYLTMDEREQVRVFNQHMHDFFATDSHNLRQWNDILDQQLRPAMSLAGCFHNHYSSARIHHCLDKVNVVPRAGYQSNLFLLYLTPTELSDQSDSRQVHNWLEQQNHYLHQVASLYNGEITQDRNCLVFGLEDEPDQAVVNVLCAATVLHHVCSSMTPYSISVTTGTLWVNNSSDLPPAVQVCGQAVNQLQLMHLHNRSNAILIAENIFQYSRTSTLVNAHIYRDLTMPDGERLEVWQLDSLSDHYDQLLRTQSENLKQNNTETL